eukprot:TRINITY_DN31568_c0_g1_i1.p1 TRINITY_DN31568_c0_g1~~TRINITY_DN31568_c0_g1_i1.p1  ORF type:complete len:196 (-),score=38.35 TRINITY_DN31568_c0_g1_i1:253-840(-)
MASPAEATTLSLVPKGGSQADEVAPPAPAPTAPISFPAFRSEAWIRATFDKLRAPAAVLRGVDLTPTYMLTFPSVGYYPNKVAHAKEEIRTALFRQALSKVQNVEVTYMEECKESRILENVVAREQSSVLGSAFDMGNPKDVQFVTEELWSVNRCGHNADYYVRYYREGENGFSASVVPTGVKDMWRSLQYYWSG